jgi:hypothetical protein
MYGRFPPPDAAADGLVSLGGTVSLMKCALRAVLLFGISLWSPAFGYAQRATLRPARPIRPPGISDSNSPVLRSDGRFAIYQSMGIPLYVEGASQTAELKARGVFFTSFEHMPMWIESVWQDDDGTVYGWYHHEKWLCQNKLASPVIGALVSRDGGKTFDDLGIVLESGYANDCSARNGFFAGGHGDFSVLLDQSRQYFYFYFSNYSGPASTQGVAVARMAFSARTRPAGRVFKYFQGSWSEPGVRGRVSAILPATVNWSREDTDSFWGPSLHWNTYLQRYVMLLNRACCGPGWPSGGTYVSFNPDLSAPTVWSVPEKILDADKSRWYPQVVGRPPNGTDRQAGREARFYMSGESEYEIVFEY